MSTEHPVWLAPTDTCEWLAGKIWLLFFSSPVTQRPELHWIDVAVPDSHGSTHLPSMLHRKGMSWAGSLKAALLSKNWCSNPGAFMSYIGQAHLSTKCKRMGVEGTMWTAESMPHLKALTSGCFLNTVLAKTNGSVCCDFCPYPKPMLALCRPQYEGEDMPEKREMGSKSWLCHQQALRTMKVTQLLRAHFPPRWNKDMKPRENMKVFHHVLRLWFQSGPSLTLQSLLLPRGWPRFGNT